MLLSTLVLAGGKEGTFSPATRSMPSDSVLLALWQPPGGGFRVCDDRQPEALEQSPTSSPLNWQFSRLEHWEAWPQGKGMQWLTVSEYEQPACTGTLSADEHWLSALTWDGHELKGRLSLAQPVLLVRFPDPNPPHRALPKLTHGASFPGANGFATLAGAVGFFFHQWPPSPPYPGGGKPSGQALPSWVWLAVLLIQWSLQPESVNHLGVEPSLTVDVDGEDVTLFREDLHWLFQHWEDDAFDEHLAVYVNQTFWLGTVSARYGWYQYEQQQRLARVFTYLRPMWAAIHQALAGVCPEGRQCPGQHGEARSSSDSGNDSGQQNEESGYVVMASAPVRRLRQSDENQPPPTPPGFAEIPPETGIDTTLPSYSQFIRMCQRNQHEHLRQVLEAAGSRAVTAWVQCYFGDQLHSMPLHLAVQYNSLEIVELLLAHSPSCDPQDKQGATPLYRAVQQGRERMIKPLLDAGADRLQTNEEGWTVLHLAAFQGNVGSLRALLAQYPESVRRFHPDPVGNNGFTPLHAAAKEGKHEVVRVLLDNGVDLQNQTNDGITPLYLAARFGHSETVALLLARGADPQQARHNGQTPLQRAMELGHRAISRMLFAPDAEQLATLCQRDNAHQLQQWLAHFSDRERRDWVNTPLNGRLPLCLAVQYGGKRTVSWLLNHDADPNALDCQDNPILVAAVHNSDLEIVQLLLLKYARPNQANGEGLRALHLAALNGQTAMARALLKGGADPKAVQVNGTTALHLAALGGHVDVMRVLLKKGASVKALIQPLKVTPLHLAVKSENPEAVSLLLENGAKPQSIPTGRLERCASGGGSGPS